MPGRPVTSSTPAIAVLGHDRQVEDVGAAEDEAGVTGLRPTIRPPRPLRPTGVAVRHRPFRQREPGAIDVRTDLLRKERGGAQLLVLPSHQDPAPLRAVDGHDALGDARQDGVEGDVANQRGVQLGQQGHAAALSQGLLGALPHPGDQVRGHDGHSEIDEERQDMVWRRDGEGEERRDEEEVEGEEPEHRAEHRRPESTAQRQEKGQQEIEEEHVEDAELRAEREA